MPLRDILKKHKKIQDDVTPNPEPSTPEPPEPFIFYRTDTHTQEVIQPPSYPAETQEVPTSPPKHERKRLSRFRSPSNASTKSHDSGKSGKRLSARLRLHSRTSSASSINVPEDLPEIGDEVGVEKEEREAKWEERATILATKGLDHEAQGSTKVDQAIIAQSTKPRSSSDPISDEQGDETIQEAIRLHEAGELTQSTAMFSRLASTNAMAQILYGLALRHGWGCEPNPHLGVTFLSRAASNTAAIESAALHSGMKKGGAAKGELVLAVYELANSFRQGWGVEKDPVAARKYYECAANLGDTDAMNEVARCYEDGFGGPKDKFTAAKYYRLAEQNGNKTLGNSWIWKDKYNPKEPK